MLFAFEAVFAQGAYQPQGALGAFYQGRDRANQESLAQQQMILNQLQILRTQQQIAQEVDRALSQNCISNGVPPGTDQFRVCKQDQAQRLLKLLEASRPE